MKRIMKRFNKLNPLSQVMSAIILAVLFAFVVGQVEIDYSQAAQGIPVFSVSGVSEGSLVNTGGRVGFTAHNYLDEIREGNISGHTFIRIEGNNAAVGTALEEISDLGTVGFGVWPAAEGLITIGSSSALDTAGGTGALTAQFSGLDSTFTPIIEVVNLNGLDSSVSTLDSFFRLNEIKATTAGSGGTNAGLLTASIGGTAWMAVLANHTRSLAGRYTVPAGMTLYLQGFEASVVGVKQCTFHLYTKDTQTANAPWVLVKLWQASDGGYFVDGRIPAIPEKTDVIFLGEAGGATTITAASAYGWLEE